MYILDHFSLTTLPLKKIDFYGTEKDKTETFIIRDKEDTTILMSTFMIVKNMIIYCK